MFGPDSPDSDAPVVETATKSPPEDIVPHSITAMHRMEFESREELDEDEARVLVQKIRARL